MSVDNFLEDSDIEPAQKQSKRVRFAPGTKKSNEKTSTIVNHPLINPNKQLYDNDDDAIIKTIHKPPKPLNNESNINSQSIDLTNFKFGTQYSASESEDEKSFTKIIKKYQKWSPQFVNQTKKKENKIKKLNECKKSLENTTQILNNLKKKRGDNTQNEKKIKGMTFEEYKIYKKKESKKGIIYLSKLPFGATGHQLRKIFTEFGSVSNVFLESVRNKKGEKEKIYNKWDNNCEGWIEFENKNIAKMVARLINDSKIPKKYVNNKLARNFIWNIKYLKGFKWHHLQEYRSTIRQLQKKKFDLAINEAHRQTEFFKSKVKQARNEINKMNNNNVNNIDNNDVNKDDNREIEVEREIKRRKISNQRMANVRKFNKDKAVEVIKEIWKN